MHTIKNLSVGFHWVFSCVFKAKYNAHHAHSDEYELLGI